MRQTNLWKLALFVDEGDDIERLGGKKVKDFLVVLKMNVLPFNALLVVLGLLQLEDVVHKELLEVLVAEVDAQLLEAIGFESLEPKDVQNTNGESLVSPVFLQRIHGNTTTEVEVQYGRVR